MKWLKRLVFVFKFGDEIEDLIKKMKEEKLNKECALRANYLNLCKDHQPCSPGSHYVHSNCDYCKLVAKGRYKGIIKV